DCTFRKELKPAGLFGRRIDWRSAMEQRVFFESERYSGPTSSLWFATRTSVRRKLRPSGTTKSVTLDGLSAPLSRSPTFGANALTGSPSVAAAVASYHPPARSATRAMLKHGCMPRSWQSWSAGSSEKRGQHRPRPVGRPGGGRRLWERSSFVRFHVDATRRAGPERRCPPPRAPRLPLAVGRRRGPRGVDRGGPRAHRSDARSA